MPNKDDFLPTFQRIDEEYNLATRTLGKPGKDVEKHVTNVKLRMIALRKNGPEMDKLVESAQSASAKKATPQFILNLMNNLERVYKLLNADMKELSKHAEAAIKLPANSLSEADQKRVTALDIMRKQVNALSNSLKMQTQMRISTLKETGSFDQSAKELLVRDLTQYHLAIRKGADDSEALLKKFVAHPEEATMLAAFAAGNGLRSIGTAKMGLAHIVKKHPAEKQIKVDLEKFWPEDSAKRIKKYTDKKRDVDYWRKELDPGKKDPNWIRNAAVSEAKRIITVELPIWRKYAADVKTLYKA